MISKKKGILYLTILLELVVFCGGINLYKPEISGILKYICLAVEILALVFIGLFVWKSSKTSSNQDREFTVCEILLFSLLANYKLIYIYANNILEIPFYLFFSIISAFIILFLLIEKLIHLLFRNNTYSMYFAVIITFLLHFTIFSSKRVFFSNLIILDYGMFIAFILMIYFSVYVINITKVLFFFKRLIIILLIMLFFTPAFESLGYYSAMAILPGRIKISPKKECKRDIYFILLDMYAGSNTLKSLGYDNTSFYKSLEKKGFKVYENFTSNYNKTIFTIPSILNCDYLENIPPVSSSEAIDKSIMFYLARKTGYKICYLNSWPLSFKLNPDYYYELYVDNKSSNRNIITAFFQNSAFENIIKKYFLDNLNSNDKTKEQFISDVINVQDKKFVFLHLLMPHWPYMCDENGEKPASGTDDLDIWTTDGRMMKLNTSSYIAYLKFTNKYVENIIDKILKTSSAKPIIVIFGDHGVRKRYYINNEKSYIDDLLTDKNYLYSHFNTILAYYYPENEKPAETKTLVNFFRMFANSVFGTDFKQKENKKFYAYYDHPGSISKQRGFWVH